MAEPFYDLETVRQLASQGHIQYAGRRVQLDIQNLNYELNDVLNCLCTLLGNDFCHTENYDGERQDVYKTRYQLAGSNQHEDELYIKLLIQNNQVCIQLCSFHLQRK